MKIKSYYFLRDEYVHLLEKRLALQQKLQNMRSYSMDEGKEVSWRDIENYKKRSKERDSLQLEHDKLKRILWHAKVFANDTLQYSLAKRVTPRVGLWRKISVQIHDLAVELIVWGYKTLQWRLSYASPLGRSLLWKSVGAEVEMRCGDEVRKVKLLGIW